MKLYNITKKPIIWENSYRTGKAVIHPRKFDIFSKEKAEELKKTFKGLVSEEEYKKIVEKEQAEAKAAAEKAKKEQEDKKKSAQNASAESEE